MKTIDYFLIGLGLMVLTIICWNRHWVQKTWDVIGQWIDNGSPAMPRYWRALLLFGAVIIMLWAAEFVYRCLTGRTPQSFPPIF